MSADRLSGSNAEDAVSILVEIRGPRPTFIGAADIHLPPKSFSNWATGLKAHAVSVDESPRLAFGVPVPGVTLGGNAGLLAAAAPTEAVAVGPFNNRGATIGVKHWNLRSGGPLGVTSTAKGNLYARNYSTFTLSGGL